MPPRKPKAPLEVVKSEPVVKKPRGRKPSEATIKKRQEAERQAETIRDLVAAMLDVQGITESQLPQDDADPNEVKWTKQHGVTPVEFLTLVYRNQLQPIEVRISAARSLLDYIHRKMPAKIEVDASLLDSLDLSKLSDEDIAQFTAILSKAKGAT